MLAIGITSMIIIQALINMAVVTSLMPVTGITLPLISYGGSSLVINLVGLALLLNISRYVEG
jgi:cell division protein FtsW